MICGFPIFRTDKPFFFGSLLADVRCGSFVTYSFLPHGRLLTTAVRGGEMNPWRTNRPKNVCGKATSSGDLMKKGKSVQFKWYGIIVKYCRRLYAPFIVALSPYTGVSKSLRKIFELHVSLSMLFYFRKFSWLGKGTGNAQCNYFTYSEICIKRTPSIKRTVAKIAKFISLIFTVNETLVKRTTLLIGRGHLKSG